MTKGYEQRFNPRPFVRGDTAEPPSRRGIASFNPRPFARGDFGI